MDVVGLGFVRFIGNLPPRMRRKVTLKSAKGMTFKKVESCQKEQQSIVPNVKVVGAFRGGSEA